MSGYWAGGPAPAIPLRTVRSAITEQGVMREYVAAHADTLRYDHDRGRWLVWDQHHWRPDRRKKAFFYALEHCHRLNKAKTDKASFANAVETMARAHPDVSTCADDWNPSLEHVACPAGVIELATGDLRPGRPADMIDRAIPASPDNTLDAPVWFAFLDTMFAGDGEIIDFLQRFCGYCLSGDTSEHKFLFLHGKGANGKSTLLNTIAAIWGELCATASIDVFLESQIDRHTTELARLAGRRVVLVHETREGRRWDEAKIKTLTGGEKITARFMRHDDFEFTPQFKLVFAGNHKPVLRSVDEAMTRRLLLLPCVVTIPPDQRDPLLGQKLWAEAPRILAWMIEGFRHWRRSGLNPPASIAAATSDYLSSQDDLRQWREDRTENRPGSEENGIALFRSWDGWKRDRNEEVGTARSFYAKLNDAGVMRKPKTNRVIFVNIRLS